VVKKELLHCTTKKGEKKRHELKSRESLKGGGKQKTTLRDFKLSGKKKRSKSFADIKGYDSITEVRRGCLTTNVSGKGEVVALTSEKGREKKR